MSSLSRRMLSVPPITALLVVFGWHFFQQHSISNEKKGISRIEDLASAATASTATAETPKEEVFSLTRLVATLKKLDLESREYQSVIVANRPGMFALTIEELLKALDQISTMEMTDGIRTHLELLFGELLTEKDPELALRRFSDRLKGSNSRFKALLETAFRKWVGRDLEKATAWLDAFAANGAFDSPSLTEKEPLRRTFESQLILALLSLDPDAASKRLGMLPGNEAAATLNACFYKGPPSREQRDAYVKLVQERVPVGIQPAFFAGMVRSVVSDGTLQDSSYVFDQYQIPASVRTRSAEMTAMNYFMYFGSYRKASSDNLIAVDSWLSKEGSSHAGAIIGRFLSNYSEIESRTFQEAAEIAGQYLQASHNDQFLGAFLMSEPAKKNKEISLPLMEKISDPGLRGKIAEYLK